MGRIVGIDLGTTNSAVAIWDGRDPKIIPNEEGGRLTPSVVAWDDKGELLVGQIARRQAVTNPENTVYSIKRLIGMRYDEIKAEAERLPFSVVKAGNGDAHVKVRGRTYSPPEVSAKVLAKLKKSAEAYLGEDVNEAVITVPAYFNDSQRQATKDAGRIAGLEVKRIVNEPTAAALAYGLDKKGDQVIAVYDLGGGTFDISILEVGENVVEVISTNGDTHLGGDDIDRIVMDHLINEFKQDTGIDLHGDKMVVQRLREAAEKAKIELSTVMETEINLPFLTADATGPKHFQMKLTRSKLESMIDDLVKRTLEPCKKALQDANKTIGDIHEAVLVGGSTRIPMVQEAVKTFFGREPHKGVNPDEVVALGAAVQAGVLSGDVKDMLLLDVTPLSLGIETLGGVMTTLIARNTTIPTRKTETFSTAADNQTSVEVHVQQGERPMARDNRTLGRFGLEGIPPAPRGVPQIEVTFDIDANGILNVSAKDRATEKEQRITIKASGGLNDVEIEKAMKEAEEHADEDRARKDAIEHRNKLDSMIWQNQKLIEEHGDKLTDENKTAMETAIASAKESLKSEDTDRISKSLEELQEVAHKVAEEMYARAGASSASSAEASGPPPGAEDLGDEAARGGGPAPADAGKKETIIDAEFEETE